MGSYGHSHSGERLLMHLEEEILDDLAKNMASDMDRHILSRVLIDMGWIEVTVDPWVHASSKLINDWLSQNIQGQSVKSGNSWVFEQQADATMFALKWG